MNPGHDFSRIPLFSPSPVQIQPKRTVSTPGDTHEQEADRVADQIMQMQQGALQRACAGGEDRPAHKRTDETPGQALLQTKPAKTQDVAGTAAPPVVKRVLMQSGRPLDDSTRRFMEPRFGADFSAVRLHTDSEAAESAEAVSARAYTVGNDIVFGAKQYNPGSSTTQRLLAHELTHVVQQNALSSAADSGLIQRSCFDGNCEDCAGGWKDLWVTAFFARRANRDTMTKLRARINKAKTILENCCVRLKFDFNWTLIPGAASIETASRHPRPAGDPLGLRDVPEPQESIGESDLIAGARGIPMLVVDEVRGTGGSTTILGGQDDRGQEYDVEYTGPSMFFTAVNQPVDAGCPAEDEIAHELWHITGALRHDPADGAITACTGDGVAEPYCTGIRGLA